MSRKQPTMRLTKKILLAALLPTLALALALIFAPSPPSDGEAPLPTATVEETAARPEPGPRESGLLTHAWSQVREIWLAVLA